MMWCFPPLLRMHPPLFDSFLILCLSQFLIIVLWMFTCNRFWLLSQFWLHLQHKIIPIQIKYALNVSTIQVFSQLLSAGPSGSTCLELGLLFSVLCFLGWEMKLDVGLSCSWLSLKHASEQTHICIQMMRWFQGYHSSHDAVHVCWLVDLNRSGGSLYWG